VTWAGLEQDAKAVREEIARVRAVLNGAAYDYSLPDRGPSPVGFYGTRGTVMYGSGMLAPNRLTRDWPGLTTDRTTAPECAMRPRPRSPERWPGAGQRLIGAATKTTREFLAALDR